MRIKTLIPAFVFTAAAAVPATSMADVTANIGWVSEYIFRGIFQEDSSAYAGVDYASDAGFYIGTWGADVGDGLETDLYFGYAGGEDFTYKIDYTFTSVTISPEMGPYFKIGSFSQDFDGDYFELGYGWSFEEEGVDLSVAVTTSDDLPVSDPDDGETGEWALVFGIKKNISVGE
jgi:hypothetical protein